MAYVQRFVPKGQDQVTLDYFMNNRLAQMMEPEQAQLVAQQVYDLARIGGVKQGNLTTITLDAVFDKMVNGQMSPLANPYEENISAVSGQKPQTASYSVQTGSGGYRGDLLPRTAMQSPIESMRPARYFSTADGATDFLGTSLYRLIDSSTIGLLGVAGKLLQKVGATEDNFWTETIGGRQKLFGLDFGQGGMKEADTKAGEWGSRVGEFAGFAIPIIASGGAALAARGATSAAARASIGKMAAEKAGDKLLADKMAGEVVKHAARAEKIRRTGQKVVDISNKIPANYIFEIGTKATRRMIFGEAAKGVQSTLLRSAANKAAGTVFGVAAASIAGKQVGQDLFEKVAIEAAEKAAKEGAYAGAQMGSLMSPKAMRAAKEAVEGGLYEAPEVMAAAQNTFRSRFAADVQKRLGISYKGNEEFFNNIVNNAGKAFDDAFKEARHSGGLMNLHEKVFLDGTNRFGVGLAKAAQHSASHVAGMVLMGAASRITHPIAEPSVYGVEDEDNWEMTKNIARYWLKGANANGGFSPFEGVTGDVLTGAMFATGGLTNLIPGLQKVRSKNPAEMLSRMPGMGGTEAEWKGHLDVLDLELESIYKLVKKGQEPNSKGGIAGFIQSHLRRNHADFGDLFDTNPDGFKHVATKYLDFLDNNAEFVSSMARPYERTDIIMALKAHSGNASFAGATDADKALYRSARDKIINGLFSHRKNWLEAYNRSNRADLLKDMGRFAVITTATSIMSAPTLWKEALVEDNPDIHPADLIMHTMFSAMMARHPYYMDGASIYMPHVKKGRYATPEEMRELSGMRIRNAMRHLGIRDSSLVLDGQRMRPPLVATADNPLAFDGRVNAAIKDFDDYANANQGDPNAFTVTNDASSIKPGDDTVIHTSEIQLFADTLYQRWRSGAEIDETFLNKDKTGKPKVFEETFNSFAELTRMAQVVGWLKRKMVAEGKIGKGEMFDPYKVIASEGEYLSQKIGDVSRALGVGSGDASDVGIIGRMNELVEPVEGHIRHIKLGPLPKNPDGSPLDGDTVGRAVEIIEGYNELVDIAGMLRKPIHADENGLPLPELVDIGSEKMDHLRALVEESGKVVAEMLGISRARLGRKGDLKNFIITGLVGAKTHQNLVLSVDEGVLFTSDGDHIDRKSVIRSLIENGFGTNYIDDAGETQTILWPLNHRAIEGVAGSGRPLKADVIANLYRWLRQTKNVHVMEYKPDGKVVGQDAIEKFFSKDGLLYDARGTRIENRNGGLDAVLRDVGILLDNPGLVKHMVEAIRERRRSGLSREVRELARLSELTDLFVYDRRLGKSSIAVPVYAEGGRSPDRDAKAALAETTSEERVILESIIDNLPKEYQEAVVALGRNGWKLALSEDEYAFWRSSMQKLIDAGELTGFSARDTYDQSTGMMTTPSHGTYVMIGDKANENLRALKSEIQRQMNRTVDETMKDIGEGIKILESRRAELEGKSSLTMAEKRRLKLTTGMIKLFNKAQAGGYDYSKLSRAMISSGIVTIKDGKREWKLKFGTMKDLRRLGNDLKKFYREEQLRADRYDFRTIRHMAEKQARDSILAMKAGSHKARASASEFFVASGLNMSDTVYREALDAIESVHESVRTGAVEPSKAGGELRKMFDTILRARLGDHGTGVAGSYLEDYKVVLNAVDDNYLLSIITDVIDTHVFREYSRVRGTTFPEGDVIMGGGAGDAVKRKRRIAKQETGGAVTRDYLSSRSDVSGSSRNVRLASYAKLAFLNPDGIDLRTPDKVRKFRADLYTLGISARLGERNTTDDTNSFVMLKDQSESDRYILMETPTDVLSATRLADALDSMLSQYTGHIGSKDLADAIENAKFVLENLREAIATGDDDVVTGFSLRGELAGKLSSAQAMVDKNISLKSRMDLYADVYSLVRMHEYFGSHAVIDAFQRAVTDPDALPKLFTRSKLSATDDDRRIMDYEFDSSIKLLDKTQNASRFLNAGTPGMSLDNYLLNKGGMTVNQAGQYGMTFYVYDSTEAQKRTGPQLPKDVINPKTGQPMTQPEIDKIHRTMKNLDGGIILNTHILKLLWHATGHDIFNPNSTYGLAKVRVLQVGPDGTLMTKDVMSADQGIMEYMEAANVSGIMSSEAAKVFSGIWKNTVEQAIIDYGGGNRDFFGAITHENPNVRSTALASNATKMNIPVSALVWQHPVDGNPNHATRSPQITGFRSEKFTQAIVDIVDSNASLATNVIGSLLGGQDSLSRMTQHAFFMDGKGVGLNANGVNDRYVEFGGALASPMDFGGSKHYLNALKTSVFENHLFKIKTDNGTQEVYTVDTHESLASSEIVGGHKSGLKTTNLASGMIAFEVETPQQAADIVAEVNGYGARDNYYNTQPQGPEQEQNFTTNMAHVRITGKGKYDGIYLGLVRAAQLASGMNPKDAVPIYSATREGGAVGTTRTGAVNTIKFMRALSIFNSRRAGRAGLMEVEAAAKVISDAWQKAITMTDDERVVSAAVLRALDPISNTFTGSSSLVTKMRDEIMASRAELYIDTAPGEQVIVNNNVQRFRLHNALSYMFGSYNYYKTSRNVRNNKGHIAPFGLSVVSQRHPSTMLNDTFAMVQRGFLDINDGAQVKGYWKDMEDIAKGDQDEDHFHSWYDYTGDEIGEAMRLRMITGGFGEANVDKMPQISYFRSNVPANEKRPKGAPDGLDYDEVLSKRRAAAKAGIGLISKGIATGSAMLHKGVAFEMTINKERILVAPRQAVIGGKLVFTDDRGMSILDRTQSNMQETFRGIAEVHNTYTDAKTHGSSEDPRSSDLQGFILSKFYGLWVKDPVTGEYRELKTSVDNREEALLALKGAASTLYRVSSFGKDVFTQEGRRKMNIYEMDHMSQRYNTIWGKEADTARALKHVMQIALSKEYIDFGKGRKARAISQYNNDEMQRMGESIHIVTDAKQLKSRTVYDAMSEGVVKALDTIYSQDRTAYLTEEESVARGFGMEALAQADMSVRTAKTARFVANFQGISPMAQELSRRFSDGEELLGYEAYASAALHKSGIDYMQRTQLEDAFDRGKRHTPRSPLERMIMANNTADNLSVNVARAVAMRYDTRSFEADKRLLAAYGVQQRYAERMRKLYKQQYNSAPEDYVDMDTIDPETRADIIQFLDEYGGADNMLVTALDLLTPTPDGYWFDRNNQELPAYKNFRHAFFNIIQDHLFNGMIGDYGKLTPELKNFTGTSLMELMAKSRSTVAAIMSADSHALSSVQDMIEVMGSEGRSGAGAIQFINLRSSDRQNDAKRNIFAAMIGRDFSRVVGMIEDAGFENPSKRRFGFSSNTDASKFLRDLSRDMEYTKRIRVNANMKRSGISQVRKELLSENFDEGVTAISISQEAAGVTSRLEQLLHRGEWQNLASEVRRKEAEGKPKIDYNKKALLVKKREEALLSLMLRSLDATTEGRLATLPRSTYSRGGLAQMQAELLLKTCI